jgi:hypothetical protein
MYMCFNQHNLILVVCTALLHFSVKCVLNTILDFPVIHDRHFSVCVIKSKL